jgi:hypothetical protein
MNIKSLLLAPMIFAIVSGTAYAASEEELLSGLTAQERSWIEDSCPRSLGPSVYLGCVQRETSAIRSGIPDLTGLPDDQQAWVRESCPPSLGPSVYASCIERETSALRGETVDLDSLDPDTRRWVEDSCPRSLGPSVYTSCIQRELGALEKQTSKTPPQAKARQSQPSSRPRAESVTEPGARLERNSQTRAYAKPPQPVQPDSAVESIGPILLLILAVFLIPIIWVVFSSRSHGGAKLGWIVVVLFFSWLGFAVFLIVTQPSRNSPST